MGNRIELTGKAMRAAAFAVGVVVVMIVVGARAAAPAGDATNGARVFRVCTGCHSLTPGRNMTGPSLAGVWGRKAGSLASFERYSPALKASGVVWNAQTLGAWLTSPAQFIPGNGMTFAGISDPRQRADLIAFLKAASTGKMPSASADQSGMGGMMGGMTPHYGSLKKVDADRQVRSIRLCRDSYFVMTADGKTTAFWEPNLRFKIDSTETGPSRGTPVIVPAGMMGDRAFVIFASPDEISPFIKAKC